MSRRRDQTRSPYTTTIIVLLTVAIILAAFGYGPTRSASISTENLPRAGSINVVNDTQATTGVAVAEVVHINSTERLANVTNRVGRDATVTIRLRGDSTHLGNLVIAGKNQGNATTFALGHGRTQAVDITILDDESFRGETVYFDIDVSASGFNAAVHGRGVLIE